MCDVADFEIIDLEASLSVLEGLSDENLRSLYRFISDLHSYVSCGNEISLDCGSVAVPEFFSKSLDEIYSLVLFDISERFSRG